MDVFVARQPILDRKGSLFAYELLARTSMENRYDAKNAEQATARVICTSGTSVGLEDITGGKPAFVNFSRDALLQGLVLAIPPERIVVEVLEDIEPDTEVIEAITALKKKAYLIALDDQFAYDPKMEPLLKLADIVKIDRTDYADPACIKLRERCKELGVMLLAEKVENSIEHQNALEAGFRLFQGYYYQKPEVKSGKSIASNQASQFRILQELQNEPLDLDILEKLVGQDVSLTYRLLLYINSSYFSWMEEVNSVHRAFYYLGENNIRKWLSLAVLADLTEDRPTELITGSLVRAFFCESAYHAMGKQDDDGSAFMTGLLSLLEAILLVPMAEILGKLPLSQSIKRALSGDKDEPLAKMLDLSRQVESGHWDQAAELAEYLGLPMPDVGQFGMESMRLANSLLSL